MPIKERRNFVNLNVNPCKMCMPLGSATVFKGIEGAIMILHGSQGCSTYIRRHMAAHYNEPIDIASSSLNEKGTVYGGTKNLKKALKNVIKVYNPKFIGVSTTCLAETIGEDIARIVKEFKEEENVEDIEFATVSTPGYGGSQAEGYYYAIKRIVEDLAVETLKHDKINIIAGNLTPGDIREIKSILKDFDIDAVILPDVSETLDAPFKNNYDKIPKGGTKLEDIKQMSGAKATIEMGVLVKEEYSAGKFLEEKFGVPFYKCPLPIGLKNTDKFLKLLSDVSSKPIPEKYLAARGRMLDGMIDSHKHNGEGRAAIYGEPELVYAISKLCSENGVKPLLVATSSKEVYFEDLAEESVFIDDVDFETIRSYAKKLDINILIGNSDGKFIVEKEGIPLVRVGFPIHDRVGAQRRVNVGYEGSMNLLDTITNTLLEDKYSKYRGNMYKSFYKGDEENENCC